MSSNVMSSGVMVPLSRMLDEMEKEILSEDFGLQINYEGTIAFTDERSDACGIRFWRERTTSMSQILDAIASYNEESKDELKALLTKSRAYSCYWYTGADSDMSMQTLKEFLERTGQAAKTQCS